eukprot:9425184-Lingulodinium_polyedra.AAC.1
MAFGGIKAFRGTDHLRSGLWFLSLQDFLACRVGVQCLVDEWPASVVGQWMDSGPRTIAEGQ